MPTVRCVYSTSSLSSNEGHSLPSQFSFSLSGPTAQSREHSLSNISVPPETQSYRLACPEDLSVLPRAKPLIKGFGIIENWQFVESSREEEEELHEPSQLTEQTKLKRKDGRGTRPTATVWRW